MKDSARAGSKNSLTFPTSLNLNDINNARPATTIRSSGGAPATSRHASVPSSQRPLLVVPTLRHRTPSPSVPHACRGPGTSSPQICARSFSKLVSNTPSVFVSPWFQSPALTRISPSLLSHPSSPRRSPFLGISGGPATRSRGIVGQGDPVQSALKCVLVPFLI